MKKIDIACIIDDDPIYIYTAKRMMDLVDFCNNYLIFKNGYEAITYLKPIIEQGEDTPEVIFLDLNMPVMDGWQFLEEFTAIPPPPKKEIIIYIVSSSIDPQDLEKAKSYENVDNYIVKPIEIDKLQEILNDLIESKSD